MKAKFWGLRLIFSNTVETPSCVLFNTEYKVAQRERDVTLKMMHRYRVSLLQSKTMLPLINFRGNVMQEIYWHVTARWPLISLKGLQDHYSTHHLCQHITHDK